MGRTYTKMAKDTKMGTIHPLLEQVDMNVCCRCLNNTQLTTAKKKSKRVLLQTRSVHSERCRSQAVAPTSLRPPCTYASCGAFPWCFFLCKNVSLSLCFLYANQKNFEQMSFQDRGKLINELEQKFRS